MSQIQYTTNQAYIPFLFLEIKKGCRLYLENKLIDEIYQYTMEENTFQTTSIKRKQEFSSFVCKRLGALDSYLVREISQSGSEIGRLLCLYALMKTDALFFEFMYEVYQQKLVLRQDYIESSEMLAFIREKSMESEIVANWSDATVKRLLSGYRNSMVEGGVASKEKSKLKVTPAYLPEHIKEHLVRSGDEKYVKAMLGDR